MSNNFLLPYHIQQNDAMTALGTKFDLPPICKLNWLLLFIVTQAVTNQPKGNYGET